RSWPRRSSAPRGRPRASPGTPRRATSRRTSADAALSLTLVLLVVYCALQVAIGAAAGRRVRPSPPLFVRRPALGPGLLFATLVAANIGGGSTVGAAGLGYRDGLAAWWWVGSAAIGSLFLAFGVGPRLWRVAADHDLRTVGDYLEHRYSRGVR